MVSLRKIDESMFGEIYASFLEADDPLSTADDWRPMFTIRPDQEEDHCGYVLFDGGKIVGMLGMIFSQRSKSSGGVDRFCNLHSWFVDEAYRGHSLMLMRPALRLTDTTLTDFTPTARVAALSKKLGFETLDATLKILFPLSAGDYRGNAGVEIIDELAEIEAIVGHFEAPLLRFHNQPGQGRLLATHGEKSCLLIFSRIDRHVTPYCYLHFVSNPALFAEAHRPLRRRLVDITGGRYIACDARLFEGIRLPMSFNLPVTARQLTRPAAVRPQRVDTLYSEVAVLRLSTMPSMRDQSLRIVDRIRSARPWRSATNSLPSR